MDEQLRDKLSLLLQLRKQHQTLPTPLLVGITACLSVVSLLGIAGNILVIVFFFRSLKDLPQNVYVIALACLDLAVCAIVIPSTIYQDVWREPSTDLACKLFNVLRYSLVPSSAFLLCLIAVDRFVIICFVPGIHTTRKKSLLFVALALTLGVAVGTPGGLTTGASVQVNFDNRSDLFAGELSVPHCTSDYSVISEPGLRVYRKALTTLFSLMLLLLVYFYVNIFCFVRRRQLRWSNSRNYVASKLGVGKAGDKGSGQRRFSNRGNELTEVTSFVPARRTSSIRDVLQESYLETNIDEPLALPRSKSIESLRGERTVEFAENKDDNNDTAVTAATAATPSADLELRRMLAPSDALTEPPLATKFERGNSVASEHMAQARQDLAERTRKRPHIKTARVLSVITFFYVLSYLPFFLAYLSYQPADKPDDLLQPWSPLDEPRNSSGILWPGSWQQQQQQPGNISSDTGRILDDERGQGGADMSGRHLTLKIIFYFYFINHGANPLIYGCMNTYFKQQVYALFSSVRCRRG